MKSVKEEIAERLKVKGFNSKEIAVMFDAYRLIDRLGTEIRKERLQAALPDRPDIY